MDFDEDDPLGDLLSDNSNDSFFNDDKKPKTSNKSEKPLQDLGKKKSDLFGLVTESKSAEKSPVFSNKPSTPPKNDNNTARQTGTVLKKPEPETRMGKSLMSDPLSFLDDIDVEIPKIESKTKPKPLITNKSFETKNDDFIKINDSPKVSETAKFIYNPSSSGKSNLPSTKVERKPLPIDDNKITAKLTSNDKSRRQRNNVDWLGIFNDDLNDTMDLEMKPEPSNKVLSKSNTKRDQQVIEEKPLQKELDSDKLENQETFLNKDADMNLEKESASIFLQQQESQIAVALQLKAQEQMLSDFNEKQFETQKIQTEMNNARRSHLNNIIKEQAKQREQLQNAISEQQKRINMQIEKLLELKSSNSNHDGEPTGEIRNRESQVLDEKEHFFQIIDKLKSYHDKEKDVIEYSSRSQHQYLEDYLIQTETRFKDEINKLSHYYQDRIIQMENDNKCVVEQINERLNLEISKLLNEKENIEERHRNDIKIIQDQHKLMLENLKENYLLEQNVVKNSTPYLQTFNDALKKMEDGNNECKTLVETIKLNHEEITRKEDKRLASREKEIIYLLETLDFQCKQFETQSKKMNSVHELFEVRYKEQIKIIEDEKNLLKKIKTDLDNSKYQQELEVERCKQILDVKSANLKDKEQRLKALEDDIKGKTKLLQEERESLKKEIIDINTNKESVMQIKTKYEQKIDELKKSEATFVNDRLKFETEESKTILRMNELESLTRAMLTKQKIADGKVEEAKYLQSKYEEKLKRLQEYELSFSRREKQIAKEKILLSQERLLLYNDRRENSICMMCKNVNDNQHLKLNNELGYQFNNTLKNIHKNSSILEITNKFNEYTNIDNPDSGKSEDKDNEIYNILSKYALFKEPTQLDSHS